jgi:hypothetical protein
MDPRGAQVLLITHRTPSSAMVHIKDEGSHFDAPLETVWKFVQAPAAHGDSHHQRNAQMKPISENSFMVSWEQDMDGKSAKMAQRVTILPPVGMAIEVTEGPLTGSKFFNYYVGKGNTTEVVVVGEFTDPHIPPAQLTQTVHGMLEMIFKQDNEAIKAFAAKK